MAKTTKSNRASGGTATIHDQNSTAVRRRTSSNCIGQGICPNNSPRWTDFRRSELSEIGPRGPTLIEDFHFREKIFHFDHERIPERVVHARGYAAHGFFENYKPLSKYTRADLFQRAGERRLLSSDLLPSPEARARSISPGTSGASL